MQTIHHHTNLKPFNTFGIDAYANYFVEANSTESLKAILADQAFSQLKKFILGGGSNILFAGNFNGLVIKNNIKGIQKLSEDDKHVYLKVGAGENWHQLVLYCIEHHYAGIENLSLIPGTVGAAPIQNIGAYGVELCNVFVELEALHLKDQMLHVFKNADCQFGYRDSIFKNTYRDQYVILNVTLRLSKQPTFHLEYGSIKETLAKMQCETLSIKSVSDAVIHIRRSKLPDPNELGNAGSFFKNPIILFSQYEKLKQTHPTLPHFPTEQKDHIKISAAWLIEQLGWKGKRFGDIGVYDKQALILVNYGKGTGEEILNLAEKIQQSVKDKFDIVLTPEVNLIS